ncbi:MAG: hypothetical protein OER12_11330, partial [Acidimicrobiia bacterium]|nr:hypothetical protein [Acidimicrobiia bacterium]
VGGSVVVVVTARLVVVVDSVVVVGWLVDVTTAAAEEMAGAELSGGVSAVVSTVPSVARAESGELVDDEGTVVPVAVRPGVPSTSRPLASVTRSVSASVVGRSRRVEPVEELLEPSKFIAMNTVMLIAKSPSTTTRASAFIGSCVAK